jgi:hypothetical protein
MPAAVEQSNVGLGEECHVALIDNKTESYCARRSRSTAERARPINRSLTLCGTTKRLLGQSVKVHTPTKLSASRYAYPQTRQISSIPAASLRTWRFTHDTGGRNCRAEFVRSIPFRKKGIRDLETVLFNYPIDHGFIDFIEELNTIAFRAYGPNTTLRFEEFGVDEHGFV